MNCRVQNAFHFPHTALASALRPGEIVVDLFAGGGGASEALRQALGRDPDLAINHDEWAVGMHAANHPYTRHLREDIFHADPRKETAGKHIGWLHASPDCTHFSQAKGGQPRSRAHRSLSWVVCKYAGTVRPRIISLENVDAILKWCPLIAKRDKATGRVVTLDLVPDPKTGRMVNRVADRGEQVPITRQFLVPDPRRLGQTWRHFVATLRAMGYSVEWRKLRACDYGAGTSRTRLFMVARCDGEPIRWPAPTHGPGLIPFVTAADCIDWSLPCRSIFGRKKDLAEATLKRIARGIKRFVIDAAEPFIVPVTHTSQSNVHPASEPLRTITTAKGGELAACAPLLVPRYGEREGQQPRTGSAEQPMPTIVPTGNGASLITAHLHAMAQNVHSLDPSEPLPTVLAGAARYGTVVAYMEQANTGLVGHDARDPVSTIVGKGCTQRVVAAHLMHASTSNTNGGRGRPDKPLRTILAGGTHNATIECTLSPEHEEGALRVAAFLINYYGNGSPRDLRESIDTVTTRDRLALVTVTIKGTPYVIVDIGLRMLTPPELYRAQGFPTDYIIDRTADGRRITGTNAVRMVGNSVSPPPLMALAEANMDRVTAGERKAA